MQNNHINCIIAQLIDRAHSHRIVAALTLAGASVIFLCGIVITFYWAKKALTMTNGQNNKIGSSMPFYLTISLRVLSLAAIYYSGYLLASVYRYNIRLSGHYISRSYAIRIWSSDRQVSLKLLTQVLDPNSIPMDRLPTWAENQPLPSQSRGKKVQIENLKE